MSDYQTSLFFEGGIQCDKCGETSPNEYVHTLNHTVPYGSDLCGKQILALKHIKYWTGGEGHPTVRDFIVQARNLNIAEPLIQEAVAKRRPPRPITTL